jgi:hypothetical protein
MLFKKNLCCAAVNYNTKPLRTFLTKKLVHSSPHTVSIKITVFGDVETPRVLLRLRNTFPRQSWQLATRLHDVTLHMTIYTLTGTAVIT